jgi:hypothetical protein
MREAGSALDEALDAWGAGLAGDEVIGEGAETWACEGACSGPARQAAARATGRQMGVVAAMRRRVGRCWGEGRRFKEVLTITGRVAVGLRQRLPDG